ncbi:uncharacterized protein EAE98_008968 [Botrytis deweyae]|uniref:Uncharacterized protein n=1 Tax=Botrytis deweyae TaxID=2478750 RepID=A0ABQ7ID03_9HELO|nr:uncharacterized protein EAE98_008968 [Botrytis deweyae]KAF7920275.1 hypothetical protein EAE98_008968 [Botrytis deweyae]
MPTGYIKLTAILPIHQPVSARMGMPSGFPISNVTQRAPIWAIRCPWSCHLPRLKSKVFMVNNKSKHVGRRVPSDVKGNSLLLCFSREKLRLVTMNRAIEEAQAAMPVYA